MTQISNLLSEPKNFGFLTVLSFITHSSFEVKDKSGNTIEIYGNPVLDFILGGKMVAIEGMSYSESVQLARKAIKEDFPVFQELYEEYNRALGTAADQFETQCDDPGSFESAEARSQLYKKTTADWLEQIRQDSPELFEKSYTISPLPHDKYPRRKTSVVGEMQSLLGGIPPSRIEDVAPLVIEALDEERQLQKGGSIESIERAQN